ncbi:MAG TPA: DUF1499 domain-containing protein [Vicinamibacterales bacterium]|jgi:uncharacterized protein (DUF1499 family)|nr:DUF1499 domain-containing protein [Vicinamibacterales bacterium]
MYDEPKASGVSRLAAWLGAVSLIVLASTGPLHRIGLFGLAGTFNLLKWAVYGALAAIVLAIIGIIVDVRREAPTSTALMAMLMSFIATGSIAALAWKASRVPPIHDVTTDTMQPPPFLAVLPLREGALNPVEYGGPDVAAQQKKAFPDIVPLTLKLPPARAFDRALAAARAMGWDLVASDPAGGRIEATATTFWFGFKDDVVIRVTPEPDGSRIDVRSLSRVGGGDIGANAARVRKYLAALKAS